MKGTIEFECPACDGEGFVRSDSSRHPAWQCPVCKGERTVTLPLSAVKAIAIEDTGIEKCGECPAGNLIYGVVDCGLGGKGRPPDHAECPFSSYRDNLICCFAAKIAEDKT